MPSSHIYTNYSYVINCVFNYDGIIDSFVDYQGYISTNFFIFGDNNYFQPPGYPISTNFYGNSFSVTNNGNADGAGWIAFNMTECAYAACNNHFQYLNKGISDQSYGSIFPAHAFGVTLVRAFLKGFMNKVAI